MVEFSVTALVLTALLTFALGALLGGLLFWNASDSLRFRLKLAAAANGVMLVAVVLVGVL